MKWFSGNIAEAVHLSKTQSSIFVVYIYGPNQESTAMTALLDSDPIRTKLESKHFVAISIESDSEEYRQFAEIYKIVPLPSLFFIGTNGAPIEIITETAKTVDEIDKRIANILVNSGMKKSIGEGSSSSNATDAEGAQSLTEVQRKEIEDTKTKKLLQDKELNARKTQQTQVWKKHPDDVDIQRLKEERKKAKLQDQAERKRILEQIAADRCATMERHSMPTTAKKDPEPIQRESTSIGVNRENNELTRIQFKTPEGKIDVHTFNNNDTLQILRGYVEDNILPQTTLSRFTLATSFPRKELSVDDDSKTLLDLNLTPSAVVLILPLNKSSADRISKGEITNSLSVFKTAFWTVLNPVIALLTYLRNMIFSRRPAGNSATEVGDAKKRENNISDNDAAKRRNLNILSKPTTSAGPEASAAYKRVGTSNIHRLRETEDSDDDNNTWNGNSTQQQ